MFCGELQRVNDAQNLVKVASGAHRVAEHQLDLFVRADHEDRPHGCVVRRRSSFAACAGFRRQHVVELCHFQLWVADHRIIHFVALRLFDVHGPLAVAAHRIHTESDNLYVAFLEFRLQPGQDRKSTRLNSSHLVISYAVFCLKKKKCYSRRTRMRILGLSSRYPAASALVTPLSHSTMPHLPPAFINCHASPALTALLSYML